MSADDANEDRVYRELIDRLVDDCHDGQGQIRARRARAGVWNANATACKLPEQHDYNLLLAHMSRADREIVAHLLEQEFVGGIHAALVALHEAELGPFDKAYEGTPFHDFVGRLADWKWPKSSPRS